tara:strand:+ start:522 stop:764 length:243 start_codon:yes stop_codon:yes gene_type:complete
MSYDKTMLIRCDKQLKDLADEIAQKTCSNKSQVMRMALVSYAQALGLGVKKKYTADQAWKEMLRSNPQFAREVELFKGCQ